MSVLSRDALEASPLADLHAIASELGIDGFRRLRKDDLVGTRSSSVRAAMTLRRRRATTRPRPSASPKRERERAPRPRARRGGRGRAGDGERRAAPRRGARTRRGRGRRRARPRAPAGAAVRVHDATTLPERSTSSRASSRCSRTARASSASDAPEAGDGDVYISAAQVRRCELVSGDRVSGPARRPRRSERYPSLVRVETINGAAADEVAVGTPYDELPAVFPAEPLTFKAKDPALKQIADLAPIGRGSRVVVTGGPGAGRTTVLRALAIELAAEDEIELSVVLAGARPEELPEWAAAELEPAATAGLGAGPDAQAQAVERAVDAAKRIVARGGNAAVVIDALDQVGAGAARRALAAARNVPDGGSLTVIAAAREPFGGETTVIALDAAAAALERHPVLDPARSGTLRAEALVGSRKAATVAKNRAKLLAAGAEAPAAAASE